MVTCCGQTFTQGQLYTHEAYCHEPHERQADMSRRQLCQALMWRGEISEPKDVVNMNRAELAVWVRTVMDAEVRGTRVRRRQKSAGALA